MNPTVSFLLCSDNKITLLLNISSLIIVGLAIIKLPLFYFGHIIRKKNLPREIFIKKNKELIY